MWGTWVHIEASTAAGDPRQMAGLCVLAADNVTQQQVPLLLLLLLKRCVRILIR